MHETQWAISGSQTLEARTALHNEIARLERIRCLLQKDVVVKDAYLAAVRADLGARDAEILALQEENARLHESIRETLSQPRYCVADAINRALRRVRVVHHVLKLALTRVLSLASAADAR